MKFPQKTTIMGWVAVIVPVLVIAVPAITAEEGQSITAGISSIYDAIVAIVSAVSGIILVFAADDKKSE